MKRLLVIPTIAMCSSLGANAANGAAEPTDTVAQPATYDLEELVVEGKRSVMTSDGAKLSYNVDEDDSAAGSSVLDMLRKVPMISVDAQDNVKLNGQSNFRFQVNGKDEPMLTQYAATILKAMPASSVSAIEVITEPGAKYDAEGVGGIINLVTARKQSENGYSASLSANANNREAGAGAYGLLKQNRVTLSANVDYQKNITTQHNTGHSVVDYLTPQGGSMITDSDQRVDFNYIGGGLQLSWEPDSLNLFSASANVYAVDANADPVSVTDRRLDASGEELWSITSRDSAKLKNLGLTASASYQHNFRPTGHNLILSYLFSYGRQKLDLTQPLQEAVNYPGTPEARRTASHSYNREHTVQLDYTNDFRSEHHLLEAGVKGIFRRNRANADDFRGPSLEELLPDHLNWVRMNQPQDVYAVYGSWTGKFAAWTLVGGLRYEHTRMGADFLLDPDRDFRTVLNDIVPNAAVTYSFSPMQNLRLAYQMRISRPTLSQLNPYQQTFSDFSVQTGNPALSSEKSNKISLSYQNFGRIFGGSIGVEQTFLDNAISSVSWLGDYNGNLATFTSYSNLGHNYSTALNGFINWNIIQQMSLNLNGRLEYVSLDARTAGLKNHGWTANLNGSWSYTVATRWHFSAYGGWESRSVKLQGHSSGWHYYGLSASYDFLKDKSLNMALNANNFCEKSIKFSSSTITPTYREHTTWRNYSQWRVGISLTWKFGNIQARVKQTEAEIRNDDASKASAGKGGAL